MRTTIFAAALALMLLFCGRAPGQNYRSAPRSYAQGGYTPTQGFGLGYRLGYRRGFIDGLSFGDPFASPFGGGGISLRGPYGGGVEIDWSRYRGYSRGYSRNYSRRW